MSLFDSIKNKIKAAGVWLGGKKNEPQTYTRDEARNTPMPFAKGYGTIGTKAMTNLAAMVGKGARTYPRMLHISKPLIRNPVYDALSQLGLPTGEHMPLVVAQRGVTRVIGANKLKRMADEMGSNNAERRRLRAKFKREHRAACPA